ncbi:hypothetical protein ACFQ6N_06835 [Kitasatospora sp. NPDC056446]|uniref:hypothetical protein n=1 Tax=Kitasatospora sp. NPDC056446 TaxID=3345819 RepID=UPI0036AB1C07
MKREPVTDATVARCREAALADPASGLPALAKSLVGLAYRRSDRRAKGALRLMEEAADIHRALIAGGTVEHLGNAAFALSSLARQYSRLHLHDQALAAHQEAADLARRAEEHRPVPDLGQAAVLRAALAHALAEAGRFDEAVDAARAVADRSRAVAGEGGTDLMWRLLDVTVLLRLAGRTEEAVAVEHEALAHQRDQKAGQDRSPLMALRAAGAALWFADLGRPAQARDLLEEAARSAERLPARTRTADFGFHEAVRSALFARSGVRDEQAAAEAPEPVAVDPGQRLRPVLGVNHLHWSGGLYTSFQKGLGDLVRAVEAGTGMPEGKSARGSMTLPDGREPLAALGILRRRRDLRMAVLGERPYNYAGTTVPRLRRSIDLERRLHEVDPEGGTGRLVRAVTDLAMAQLVQEEHALAAGTLREAHALAAQA